MPASPSDLTGRARLRRAALRLFAERGFAATSMRAVATEAGLSPALVMHHFGSKEGLRAAVDQEVLDLLGAALHELDPGTGDLMASLGEVSARMFGEDPLLRGYLRRVLLEHGEAGAAMFGRLLAGARTELERLIVAEGGAHADLAWAPFQMLCLVLGPLLLEPVMQPNLDRPMFDPDVLARRSTANQRLLRHGLFGPDPDGAGPDGAGPHGAGPDGGEGAVT